MFVRQLRGPALAMLWILFLVAIRAPAAEESVETRMRKDVTFLASDELEGRGVATKGINLAADYIADEFKKAGLKPGGKDGSYFQPFTMPGGVLEGDPSLVLHGPLGQLVELRAGEHFQPVGMSHSGKVTAAPLVFVGYSATAGKDGYDDYKDLDVEGKVVVVLRNTPRADNKFAPFEGNRRRSAALLEKAANAEKRKAAAVLFVNDSIMAAAEDELMDFGMTAPGSSPAKIPMFHIRRAVLDTMLQSSLGSRLLEREQDIDRDLKPRSAPLAGWSASLEIHTRRTLDIKNVVGILEGAGALAKETVVVGAHYDHLGYGGAGSLSNLKKPAIHHGADDNASGTTALMEMARRFAQQQARGREGRRMVFIAFSGEESGLLGSVYYCKNPVVPLADTTVMLNLDMVGRLSKDKETNKDKLIVYGTGTSKTFSDLIDTLNKKYNFKLQKVAGGMGPSDHASFYAKQVPVFFFFTGDHPDYHRPSDTADKINVAGMRRVTDMATDLLEHLVHMPDRPQYVKIAGSSGMGPGGPIPRIGIRPSYGDDEEGVLLEGVVDGGPAEKAGLKEGDRLMDIAGKSIKNLEAYMVMIRGHKKGEALEFGVLRAGKKLTVKVMPE